MLAALARFALRARYAVLLCAAIALPLSWWFGRDVLQRLQPGGFRDPRAESTLVEQAVRGFGASGDLVVLYEAKAGTVDDVDNLSALVVALGRVEGDAAVERVLSFASTGAPTLLSRDRTKTIALLTLRGSDPDKVRAAQRLKPLLVADGYDTSFGGYVELFVAIPHTVERDLQRAELLAFPITALLLLLLFRSVVSAALPLVIGGLSILGTFAILRLLSMFSDVTVFAASLASILGLGLSIDYALFIVARFREERRRGRSVERALWIAMHTAGNAVLFSGATVAVSLCSLFMFRHGVLRSIAVGGIAVTIATVLIALTVLPALLSVVGRHIDAWRLPIGMPDVDDSPGIWPRLVMLVERMPVRVAAATTMLLLVMAAPFARFDASIADERALERDSAARRVKQVVDAEFFPHQTTAIDVVATFPDDARAPASLDALQRIVHDVGALSHVARVDSALLLAPGDVAQARRMIASADAGTQQIVSLFLRGHSARLAVVPQEGPDAATSLQLVRTLRALSVPGATLQVGGQSAWVLDVREALVHGAPQMIAFIAIAMLVVLFLLFGSVVLPFKALAMNALSLSASFGLIVFVFQDGRWQDALAYEATGVSEAVVPVLMLAIAFGLSMDYEVLLLARMQEEWRRSGDNARAIREGISRTGRLITSAAGLFIVVVLCFATSRLLLVKMLAIGMAAAVFLDATVVRALLVPATMHLLGRWNWWAPSTLQRWQQRLRKLPHR